MARSRRPQRLRTLSAGSVVKVGALVYVLAALLNSSSLVDAARDLRPGSGARSFALPLARANHAISRFFRTAALGERVDEWRGIRVDDRFDFPDTSAPTTAPSISPTLVTVPGAPTTVAVTAPPTTVATTTTVFSKPTGLRTPTASDPARVYIAGDSLVTAWGEALQRRLESVAVAEAGRIDDKAATGLMRPDAFNWPRRLAEQVKSRRPDIVLVGFGGNDGQAIEVDGVVRQVGDPEWQAEYRRRVSSTLDFLTQDDDRVVIWVGTPMPRHRADFGAQDLINQIYRDEIGKRQRTKFVDAWKIMASPEGTYAAFIEVDGEVQLVRRDDGFHLNMVGADVIAAVIYELVIDELVARGAETS